MNDDDVRLTSRLHVPAKRIRGFQSRRIGPKDGEDFIGGNYATAISFEGQLPNLLPEDTKTDISIFMDAANLWKVDYSDTIDDSSKIRTSVGVSANMFTTIGPLSITIAQDLSKATTDKTETFNFRLGTSF
jgi:outer membrane protein insertion porin family